MKIRTQSELESAAQALQQGAALPRACMRNRVRDVLVARILDGSYPSGFHLKELTLAAEFKVSQAPVREALRELEVLNLVVSEPYRGTRVRGVDLQELREAYELRFIIELRSLERASTVTAEQLASLDAHVAAMHRALEQQVPEAYVQAALQLHRQYVEDGGNRSFLAAWDSLHWEVRARISMRQIKALDADLTPMLALHTQVVECLRRQDRVAAMDALREVYRVFGQWLIDTAEQHSEKAAG